MSSGGWLGGWTGYVPSTSSLTRSWSSNNQADNLVLNKFYTKDLFVRSFLKALENIKVVSPVAQRRLYGEMVTKFEDDEQYEQYLPEDPADVKWIKSGHYQEFVATCKKCKDLFLSMIRDRLSSSFMVDILFKNENEAVLKFKNTNWTYTSYLTGADDFEGIDKEVKEKKATLIEKIDQLFKNVTQNKILLVNTHVQLAGNFPKKNEKRSEAFQVYGWHIFRPDNEPSVKIRVSVDKVGDYFMEFTKSGKDLIVDNMTYDGLLEEKSFVESLTYHIAMEILLNTQDEQACMKIIGENMSIKANQWFGEPTESDDLSNPILTWSSTYSEAKKKLPKGTIFLVAKQEVEGKTVQVPKEVI